MSDTYNTSPEAIAADDSAYAEMAKEMAKPDAELADLGFEEAIEPEAAPTGLAETEASNADGADDDAVEIQARTLLLQEQLAQEQAERRQLEMHDDPVGFFERELAARDRSAGQLQFANIVHSSEQHQRQVTPDYDDACVHLEQSRRDELAAIYPDKDPSTLAMARKHGFQTTAQFRNWVLDQDRMTVAATALRRGQSPAAFYYQLAQQRGWQGSTSRRSSRGRSSGFSSLDKAQRAALKAADSDDDAAFDKAWEQYANAYRSEAA